MRKDRPRKDFEIPLNKWQKTLTNYISFDDYVKDYPEGESFRAWITADSKERLVIIQSTVEVFSGSLPGCFYWVTNTRSYVNYKGHTIPSRVFVHGSDDGCLEKEVPEEELDEEFEDMLAFEHFDMSWFEERGYQYGS
jgi:hypothetical protein